MAALNPYLNFHGNTEEAFNFYKSVFGGEFMSLQRFKDTEHGPGLPDKEKNMIMHIALPFGDGNILMGTDTLDSMGQNWRRVTTFRCALRRIRKRRVNDYLKDYHREGRW